ncbi:MAG: fused vitamin K epoxide reductase/thioredoxin, partial [Proteobacteria bacterium]
LMLLIKFNMTEDRGRTERFTFYLASFMAIVSVIMGGISLFILKSACPFCMATYALSFITLGCLYIAYGPDFSKMSGDVSDAFTTEKWILGLLVAIPVISFLINSMTLDSYGYDKIKQMSIDSQNSWNSAPVQQFDIQNGLQYQNGTGPAKVVLVEFADFLCPHCKAAVPNLHNFAKAHPDVKLVFKSFPLDGSCNPAPALSKGDGKRCEYAFATFCAETVAKKGWQAHNYFFDRQESLYTGNVDEIVTAFAKAENVDFAQLKSCMTGEPVREQVRNMSLEADKAQIGGTPTVFYNNRVLNGGQLKLILESMYRNTP